MGPGGIEQEICAHGVARTEATFSRPRPPLGRVSANSVAEPTSLFGMTAVDDYVSALEHPRAAEVRTLVNLITAEFSDVAGFESEVKWNAPSFSIDGVNVVTLRLFPEPHFQVILHEGSKKAPPGRDLRFEVAGVEHKWLDPCRCQLIVGKLVTTDDDFAPIISVINEWVAITRA